MCIRDRSLIQEVPPDQSLEDVVGRPIPHLAATKQATGEAAYCDDIPKYAGIVHVPQGWQIPCINYFVDCDSPRLHIRWVAYVNVVVVV